MKTLKEIILDKNYVALDFDCKIYRIKERNNNNCIENYLIIKFDERSDIEKKWLSEFIKTENIIKGGM